jgi:hypothetical protein
MDPECQIATAKLQQIPKGLGRMTAFIDIAGLDSKNPTPKDVYQCVVMAVILRRCQLATV